MLPPSWRALAPSTSLPSSSDKIPAVELLDSTCSSKCNIHVFLHLGILAHVLSSSASAPQLVWLEACRRCLALIFYRDKLPVETEKIRYIL